MNVESLDSREIKEAVIEWDVLNWSNALVHWSNVVNSLNRSTTRILCVGERNGGLSLWFALQGFKVICSDYGGPKQKARELHAKYGVSHLVDYADLSIFSLPFEANSFDVVACKSVIGGLKLDYRDRRTRTLENQKLAVDEVRRVLKSGGYFLGAENMRGSWMHRLGRKVLKGKRIGWRHFQSFELKELFKEFSTINIHFFGFFGTYYPVRILNKILGKADTLVSKYIYDELLYIGFIWARK